MKRSIIAAIMFALIAVHVAAGEEDLATQIKALQKQRVEMLTRLVAIRTSQYKAQTVPCEDLMDAETDLVNAQLDATDKREEQVAVLTAAMKREVEDLGLAAKNDDDTGVLWWDSIHQHTVIRGSRLVGSPSAEIKKEQKKRIAKLTELVKRYRQRFIEGLASLDAIVRAQAALLDARIDATEKPEERVALLEEEVKSEAELFKFAEAKWKASVDSARSLLLDARVRLLRGCGPKDHVAAQVHAAQKERVEALTDLVKADTDLYQTGLAWSMTRIPVGPDLVNLVNAADTSKAKVQADLVNAQVTAADTSEAKVLMLTKAAKAQTEYLKVVEARYRAGTVCEADVDRERLRLLDFKIRLLRERGLQKPRNQ